MPETMSQADVEAFVSSLPHVQQSENYGYKFFFYGDDHLVPFVTVAASDNEHDDVSNLDRDGVFRINIGVSRETFGKLFEQQNAAKPQDIDYTILNVLLPHPHYAAQRFICILNPEGDNVEATKRLMTEAHALAEARARRKKSASSG